MRRFRFRFPIPVLCGVLAVVLANPVLARSTLADARGATPAPAAGDLHVTEQREVTIDGGWPAALSPDGHWLAVWREAGDAENPVDEAGGSICAYDAATLAEDRCAATTAASFDANSATWSPDGTRLAFTENLSEYFDDADLWVFDAAAGTVTNLTDDGTDDLFVGADPSTALGDLAPAWSPDGTEIAFARSVVDETELYETALYRIAAEGGEPRKVVDLDPGERLPVFAGVRWQDDDTLLYSVVRGNGSGNGASGDGLWAVSADGGEPRRVLDADPVKGPPILVAVSTQGQGLLFYPRVQASASTSREESAFAVIDLATEEVEPLEPTAATDATDATAPYRRVRTAAFSPDGGRLLVATGGIEYDRLVVRDLTTGDEREVPLPREQLRFSVHPLGGGTTWATNGIVFVVAPGRAGTLVRLEAD